jgi:hypothetical protein
MSLGGIVPNGRTPFTHPAPLASRMMLAGPIRKEPGAIARYHCSPNDPNGKLADRKLV